MQYEYEFAYGYAHIRFYIIVNHMRVAKRVKRIFFKINKVKILMDVLTGLQLQMSDVSYIPYVSLCCFNCM